MRAVPTVKRVLDWRLFQRRAPATNAFDVIRWWELRRIPFNAAVGGAGLIACSLILAVAATVERRFGEDWFPNAPSLVVVPVLYGLGANICFTFGWIGELIVRKLWPDRGNLYAETSFVLGAGFSLALTMTPALLFLGLLALRSLTPFRPFS